MDKQKIKDLLYLEQVLGGLIREYIETLLREREVDFNNVKNSLNYHIDDILKS